MMRKIGLPALTLVALMLAASAVWAGDGTAGSTYLDPFAIGVGAGPSAVAAYTAAPGDLWSLTYNPAGLANLSRVQLGVSQIEWFMDSSYSYLGLGMPRGDGGLALGLAYFDLGAATDPRDPMGTVDPETYEGYNFGFIGGYGFELPYVCDLRAGVSGHVVQANLDETGATAIGVNLGLLYGMMENQVHLGVAVRNLGTKFEFESDEDEQNLTYAAGVSYVTMPDQIPNVDVMVGLDGIMEKDQDPKVAVGGELWVYDMLALRVGYKTGTEMGNLSFGAGFKYSDFQLDYTYADFEDLEDTHRISLMMSFGD